MGRYLGKRKVTAMCEQDPQSASTSAAMGEIGMIKVVCDFLHDTFRYDSDIGEKLAGTFDDRSFWRILLHDGVASENDVVAIQSLIERAHIDAAAARGQELVSLRVKEGGYRPFTMRVVGEYNASGRADVLYVLFIDVGEEYGVNRRLIERMGTDELTGLERRDVFLARVRRLVREAPPSTYVMAYFDVDKFSLINESYGHQRGDSLLRFIAHATEEACRQANGLCCRLSADCFAVCVRHEPAIGEQFLKNYRAAFRREDIPIEITISFGLCVIDDPSLSPEIVLDHAALAQRSVKGSYVTRYAYYDDALRRTRLRRQEIEGEMNAARKKNQFDIYVQPQFSLSTGRLTGGETLVRWFHPERGIIMPSEFIPIFEQNGFISELDSFVWERACALLKKWIAADGENALSLSVNISRVNLLHMDVVKTLCTLTERYGVPPRLLRLEITESAYADNPRQLIEVVQALQACGFAVEMDDFGSGYSSLNTLKDVPIDALKLDLQFLAGDTVSGRGGSIINSIIRMARWLQLPVVAEGVETRQQADFLISVGCDCAQGYLYGKPMPVTEFEAIMHAEQRAEAESPVYVDMADANAFWNPDSQETLIFNSYVGGAAIMEYAGGHVELLRANGKFRDMMRMENIGRYVYILEKVMLPEDRKLFIEMLDDAIASGEETTCTTRLFDAKRGGDACFWLRNRARVLCKSRSYTIFYIAIEDVTAEHEAQQRYHISQDTLLAAAAHTHLQYWTYNFVNNTSVQGVEAKNNDSGLPKYIENYPQALFDLGFIHPDHIEAYRKLHTDLKAGARTVSTDALTGGEGHWEWRKIRYTAVPDEDGVVRSAIGTSESLSAYKALEQRFMTAVQQCGLLTWTLDLRARSIHTELLAKNGIMDQDTLTDMPESFLAKGYVHPEDAAAFAEAYEKMYAGEAEALAVVRCRPYRGERNEWRWYRLTFTAVADKDGRTGTAVCSGMDVTEQVNMQARYHEAVSYYESLDPAQYESILHANITNGTAETKDGALLPYARAVTLLTERIPDEAERARMEKALSPDTFTGDYNRGASRFSYEYRLRFGDGAVRWVCTNVRLLLDTGRQELCAFIFTRDINDDKMKALVFERIVLEDYDFVTIIDTVHDSFIAFVTDSSDEFIPSAEQYSFSDAAEIFALTTAPEDDAHLYIRETRIPHMLRRLSEEGSYSFQYHERLRDGSLKRKRMSLKMIDESTGYVCLTRLDVERMTGEG